MNAKRLYQRASLRTGHAIRLILLAAGLGVLAGCVSQDAANQIKNFSAAVSLTMSNTAAAYNLVDKAHVDAEFDEFVIVGKPSDIEPGTFAKFFSTNDIQVRLGILTRLQTYATRLSALMGNPVTNLDQNTTKLGQNLGKLNDDVVTNVYLKFFSSSTNVASPLTTTDIQIFTTAVNALTDWIIEVKEQTEAKKSIEFMQANTNLPAICRVLTNDFLYLTNQLHVDEDRILLAEKQFIKVNSGQLDPIQRRAELMRLVRMGEAKEKAVAALEATEQSIVKLQAVHQSLANAFSNNSANLSSLISEVSSQGQRIASYYSSLRTNN